MPKRKWGDRADAVWLKDIPSMNRIMPGIMPAQRISIPSSM